MLYAFLRKMAKNWINFYTSANWYTKKTKKLQQKHRNTSDSLENSVKNDHATVERERKLTLSGRERNRLIVFTLMHWKKNTSN